jgi:hypothetical protein
LATIRRSSSRRSRSNSISRAEGFLMVSIRRFLPGVGIGDLEGEGESFTHRPPTPPDPIIFRRCDGLPIRRRRRIRTC